MPNFKRSHDESYIYTPHELGTMTTIFRAFVEVDDQCPDVGAPFSDGVSPLGKTIGEAVTRDFWEPL